MAFRRRPPVPPDERPTVVRGGPPPPRGPAPPPGEPDRYLWPWLALLLVILAVGGGLAAYFATRGDGEKKIVIPKVLGLTQPDAVDRLDRLGLDTSVNEANSRKAPGVVIAQKPGAGTQAGRGDLVVLTVSKGPATVAVPNLQGLTEAQAVAALTKAGLQANVVQVPSSQPAGRVIAQNPSFGNQLDRGSTVRLNVSTGPAHTTTVTTTTRTATTSSTTTTTTTTPTTTTTASTSVPNVVSQTLPSAVSQLTSANLLADSYPVSSGEAGGTVVSQNPSAGSSVDEGSLVRLNVSVGTARPKLPVPNVVGLSQKQARVALSKRFTVRTVFSTSGTPGNVTAQTPAAGTPIRRWAQVQIRVPR